MSAEYDSRGSSSIESHDLTLIQKSIFLAPVITFYIIYEQTPFTRRCEQLRTTNNLCHTRNSVVFVFSIFLQKCLLLSMSTCNGIESSLSIHPHEFFFRCHTQNRPMRKTAMTEPINTYFHSISDEALNFFLSFLFCVVVDRKLFTRISSDA